MSCHCRPFLPPCLVVGILSLLAMTNSAFMMVETHPRMRKQPIQDLVDGLVQLGVVSASCVMWMGGPTTTIDVQGLPSGMIRAPPSAFPLLPCSLCALPSS